MPNTNSVSRAKIPDRRRTAGPVDGTIGANRTFYPTIDTVAGDKTGSFDRSQKTTEVFDFCFRGVRCHLQIKPSHVEAEFVAVAGGDTNMDCLTGNTRDTGLNPAKESTVRLG